MTHLADGEKLYRIGLNADCPVHQITVGGQCFPRTSEVVSGYGSDTKRSEIQGAIVIMQAGQLDLIKEQIAHKVIRTTHGKRARARVYDSRAKRFRAMPGDAPAAGFMYVLEVTPETDPNSGPAHPTLASELKPAEAGSAADQRRPRPSRG